MQVNELSDAARTLDQFLARRHSCRAFLNRPAPREAVQAALQMAQKTASWSNVQPWDVTIASGAAVERLRESLRETSADDQKSDFEFPSEFKGVYQQRRQDCGRGLYDALGIVRGDKAAYVRQTQENFRFFGAPHVAILTSDPGLGTYGAVDVGGYVQILMLALQAQGLASIAQGALAMFSPIVKSVLDIDESRKMVCGISFGYEDLNHPANTFRTSRAPIEETVRWIDV